jgi:O-antigen/teichoic acid export membrane protein
MKNLYQIIHPKVILSRLLPKNSLSRNAVLVVFGDGITFASSIVVAMVLARIITVDAMATYRQILYLGALAQSVVEFGLSSSIYRFWNLLDARGRSTYIKMQLTLSMSLGLAASVVLAVLAPLVATWYHNPDLRLAMLITCASPLVNIVPLTIRPVMICKGKPLTATFTQMAFSLAMVLGIIIPFYFTSSLNTALIVWMVVNLIEVFLTFVILRTEFIPGTPVWNKKLFTDTWDYLWPIQAGRVPTIVTSYTDKIATSIFLSTESFAAYSLGARELPFIGTIGTSISSVLIPKPVQDAESGDVAAICRRWKSACERSSLLTYSIIGFCVWFSAPLVRFLYSSKYDESTIPFAVFSAIAFLRVVEYGSLAKAFGKTGIIMKAALASMVTMLVLSFPLTAWLGIWGMSLAVLCSTISAVIYYLWAYIRLLKVGLSEFYPWKRLLLLFVISLSSAAIVGTLLDPLLHLSGSTAMVSIGLKLFILFAVDVIVYFGGLLITRVIKIDQLKTLVFRRAV